jgi:UDP-N-acetylglucosamine--N-acetylmuramyl-(pentapeptide) pyrophosphoryl-undecaprenol N-acetylglucosamine transferase
VGRKVGLMKICVACGGTGGHIFPGLATACELRSRGHAVTLWLAGRDVEAASVDGWDGDIISIRAAGFPSGLSLRAVGSVFRLCGAVFASWRIMRRARPDVVLAMGSYASVGPVIAARLCGVPVVLHEANAVPGRAISFLSRFATRIGITFEAAASYFDGDKVCLTGFPLRKILGSVDHIPNTVFHLLVMGGSQGAHALNETVPEAIKQLSSQGVSLRVTHLAGLRDADAVEKRYQESGVAAEVHAFTSDMATIYAAADFAIARAGAATCTELAICGVPALLVPHPTAARNHQMLNAMAMADVGGMVVQSQQDLTVDWLVGYLKNIVETPDVITAMRSKLSGSTVEDGAVQLANCVEATAAA